MKIELAKASEEAYKMKTILTTSHFNVTLWLKGKEAL